MAPFLEGVPTTPEPELQPDTDAHHLLGAALWPGTPVAVRNHFDGGFSAGFEVYACTGSERATVRYEVRRTSDGTVLPVSFHQNDVTRDEHARGLL